jgi:hypothetical protein
LGVFITTKVCKTAWKNNVLKAIFTNTKCQNFEVSSAENTDIKIKANMETEILATKKKRSHLLSTYFTSNFKKEMKKEKYERANNINEELNKKAESVFV